MCSVIGWFGGEVSTDEKLHILNPKGILERGYALVFDDDRQINKADSLLKKGDNISIHFSDRIANTTVNKVEKK